MSNYGSMPPPGNYAPPTQGTPPPGQQQQGYGQAGAPNAGHPAHGHKAGGGAFGQMMNQAVTTGKPMFNKLSKTISSKLGGKPAAGGPPQHLQSYQNYQEHTQPQGGYQQQAPPQQGQAYSPQPQQRPWQQPPGPPPAQAQTPTTYSAPQQSPFPPASNYGTPASGQSGQSTGTYFPTQSAQPPGAPPPNPPPPKATPPNATTYNHDHAGSDQQAPPPQGAYGQHGPPQGQYQQNPQQWQTGQFDGQQSGVVGTTPGPGHPHPSQAPHMGDVSPVIPPNKPVAQNPSWRHPSQPQQPPPDAHPQQPPHSPPGAQQPFQTPMVSQPPYQPVPSPPILQGQQQQWNAPSPMNVPQSPHSVSPPPQQQMYAQPQAPLNIALKPSQSPTPGTQQQMYAQPQAPPNLGSKPSQPSTPGSQQQMYAQPQAPSNISSMPSQPPTPGTQQQMYAQPQAPLNIGSKPSQPPTPGSQHAAPDKAPPTEFIAELPAELGNLSLGGPKAPGNDQPGSTSQYQAYNPQGAQANSPSRRFSVPRRAVSASSMPLADPWRFADATTEQPTREFYILADLVFDALDRKFEPQNTGLLEAPKVLRSWIELNQEAYQLFSFNNYTALAHMWSLEGVPHVMVPVQPSLTPVWNFNQHSHAQDLKVVASPPSASSTYATYIPALNRAGWYKFLFLEAMHGAEDVCKLLPALCSDTYKPGVLNHPDLNKRDRAELPALHARAAQVQSFAIKRVCEEARAAMMHRLNQPSGAPSQAPSAPQPGSQEEILLMYNIQQQANGAAVRAASDDLYTHRPGNGQSGGYV
ncbi:hypothetical protein CC86DRAFT_324284 [Ophiobolus disseminans]|uniref:PAT1 multi-domain protein n=1 Tax=Ophiobolus disseminans TaxID=1469910 RepID=A0A6A6ZYU1_9PLEO|nr:hypothetical protein CC86DRAFT_324284 [Ophiobolus disseminans]